VLESLLHDFAAPIINTVLRRKLGVDVLHLRRLEQREVEPRECPVMQDFAGNEFARLSALRVKTSASNFSPLLPKFLGVGR